MGPAAVVDVGGSLHIREVWVQFRRWRAALAFLVVAAMLASSVAVLARNVGVSESGEAYPDGGDYYRVVFSNAGDRESLAAFSDFVVRSEDWGAYLRVDDSARRQLTQRFDLVEMVGRTTINFAEQGVSFDTREGYVLSPEWVNPETSLRVVQFAVTPSAEWTAAVEEVAGPALMWIGDSAAVVRMGARQESRVLALDFVEWAGPYEPRFKVQAELVDMVGKLHLTISACEDVETAALIDDVSSVGAWEVEDTGFGSVNCWIDSSRLPLLARLDSVALVEHLPEMKTLCNVGGRIVQAHDLWVNTVSNLPQNIMGQGQIVHIQDTGIDASHRDFLYGPLGDRLTNPDSTTDAQYHGTFMAGVAAGNGYDMEVYLGLTTADRVYNSLASSNPAGRGDRIAFAGRAPEAEIYLRAGLVSTEWSQGYTYGARIFSNSWGPGSIANSYDSIADTFMAANPGALVLFAAGSDGPRLNTVSGYGNGKLVISVGATENMRPVDFDSSDDPNQLRVNSARGPVADGRVKPDVCEVGTAVYSTRSDDVAESEAPGLYDSLFLINSDTSDATGDYLSMQGTSVACAAASGDAILIRDYLVDCEGITSPSANLMKTLLIHGAVDIGYGYPSFDQGWGRANVRNSICPSAPNVIQWATYSTLAAGSWNFQTDGGMEAWVSDDSVPLKFTMAHDDAVGSGTLTTDYDLVVFSPDGTRYEGNAFTEAWSTPMTAPAQWGACAFPSWMGGAVYDWDTANDGGDDINNVEIVRVQQPLEGKWTATVVWKSGAAKTFTVAATGGFNASADMNARGTNNNVYKVSMSLDRERVVPERDDFGEAVFEAAPSGSFVVPVTIANGGTTTDTYALTTPTLPTGFTVTYSPSSSLALGAGDSAILWAKVSVGSAVAAGTYTIALRATSINDAVAPIAQSSIKLQADVVTSETPTRWKIADSPTHDDAPSFVSWSANGTDYIACAYRHEERYGDRVYFTLSSDGGRTWGAPVAVSAPSWQPGFVTITRATSGTYAGRLAIAYNAWNPDGYGGSSSDTRCAYVKVAYADAPYSAWTEVNAFSLGEGRSVGNTYRAINLLWHAPTNAFMTIVEVFGYTSTDLGMAFQEDISCAYKTSTNGGATWSAIGYVDPNAASVNYYFPNAVVDILGNIVVWFYERDAADVSQDRDLTFRYYNGAWGTYKMAWDTPDNIMFAAGAAAPQGVNGNRVYCGFIKGANTDGDRSFYMVWTDDAGTTWTTNIGPFGPVVSDQDYGTRFLIDGESVGGNSVWWVFQRKVNYDPYAQPNILTVSDTDYTTAPVPSVDYITLSSYHKSKQRLANITESGGKLLVGWNQITPEGDTDIYGALIHSGYASAPDTVGPVALDLALSTEECISGETVSIAASISDLSTGHSNVVGSQYKTDVSNVTPVSMQATDGSFNTPAEGVQSATTPISTAGWVAGWHWIFVRGQDAAGNWGAWNGVRIYIGPALPEAWAEIPVVEGWNLVSIPIVGPAAIPDGLTDKNGTFVVWSRVLWYDPWSPSDPWKQYNSAWSSSLNDLTAVNRTMGVWLYVTTQNDGVITIGGTGYSKPTSTIITLKAGWNLVGYPSQRTNMTVANSLLGTEADIVEASDQSETYMTRVLQATDILMPGRAYWIHVPADTTWSVPW